MITYRNYPLNLCNFYLFNNHNMDIFGIIQINSYLAFYLHRLAEIIDAEMQYSNLVVFGMDCISFRCIC